MSIILPSRQWTLVAKNIKNCRTSLPPHNFVKISHQVISSSVCSDDELALQIMYYKNYYLII